MSEDVEVLGTPPVSWYGDTAIARCDGPEGHVYEIAAPDVGRTGFCPACDRGRTWEEVSE